MEQFQNKKRVVQLTDDGRKTECICCNRFTDDRAEFGIDKRGSQSSGEIGKRGILIGVQYPLAKVFAFVRYIQTAVNRHAIQKRPAEPNDIGRIARTHKLHYKSPTLVIFEEV